MQTEDGLAPVKISEIMLEFAQPLLSPESGGPRNIREVRIALRLATLCWNAPLYAACGDYTFTRAIERVLASASAEVSSRMRAMMADRQGRFAAAPFAVSADAVGTGVGTARISASAYLLPEPAPQSSRAAAVEEHLAPSWPAAMMSLDALCDLEDDDSPSPRPALPGESFRRVTPKVGANAACPCGSGKKYKRCCRTCLP
jgi:hypothetical protein